VKKEEKYTLIHFISPPKDVTYTDSMVLITIFNQVLFLLSGKSKIKVGEAT